MTVHADHNLLCVCFGHAGALGDTVSVLGNDRRIDIGRADRVEGIGRAEVIFAQPAGQADDAMFGGRITRCAFQPLQAGNRRNHDHAAPVGLAHGGQAFPDGQEYAVEVCGHHVAPEIHCGFVQRLAFGNARVGHANLNWPVLVHRRSDLGGYVGFIAHIHGQGGHVAAGGFVQHLLTAAGDCDMRAVGLQCTGNGQPDPRATARHQCVFAGKCHLCVLHQNLRHRTACVGRGKAPLLKHA